MISNDTIILRPINTSDLEILTKWNYDEEICRFLPEKAPLNWENQKKWLENQITSTEKEKYIIHLTGENVDIGIISAFNIDRERRQLEYGITLGEKKYHGQGYATKATRLFIDHYFENDIDLIYLRVFNDNQNAIHLFRSLGFIESHLEKEEIRGGDGKMHSFLKMELKKN
jgi:RimJ/RimL family protein N-acetyltransferase